MVAFQLKIYEFYQECKNTNWILTTPNVYWDHKKHETSDLKCKQHIFKGVMIHMFITVEMSAPSLPIKTRKEWEQCSYYKFKFWFEQWVIKAPCKYRFGTSVTCANPMQMGIKILVPQQIAGHLACSMASTENSFWNPNSNT